MCVAFILPGEYTTDMAEIRHPSSAAFFTVTPGILGSKNMQVMYKDLCPGGSSGDNQNNPCKSKDIQTWTLFGTEQAVTDGTSSIQGMSWSGIPQGGDWGSPPFSYFNIYTHMRGWYMWQAMFTDYSWPHVFRGDAYSQWHLSLFIFTQQPVLSLAVYGSKVFTWYQIIVVHNKPLANYLLYHMTFSFFLIHLFWHNEVMSLFEFKKKWCATWWLLGSRVVRPLRSRAAVCLTG